MAINSSGPVSLVGCCSGVSIRKELGLSGALGLTCTSVRGLAGVASGAITMPGNFYGKSNGITATYWLAGGGGGAGRVSGGGGAGGLITGTASISGLTVVIGAGGGGGLCNQPLNGICNYGFRGGNSTFSGSLSLTAYGGGGAQFCCNGVTSYGCQKSGGNGAGGSSICSAYTSAGSASYGSQGHSGAGGAGSGGSRARGGGGGGYSGAGAAPCSCTGGNGGAGLVIGCLVCSYPSHLFIPFYPACVQTNGIAGGGSGTNCQYKHCGNFTRAQAYNGGSYRFSGNTYKTVFAPDGQAGGASGCFGGSGGSGTALIQYSGKPQFTGGSTWWNCSNNKTTHVFKYSGSLTSTTCVVGDFYQRCPGSSVAFTVPTGVTSVSVVVIGGGASGMKQASGGGGGGAGLIYANNVAVTPGQVLHVYVGYGGGYNGIWSSGTSQNGNNSFVCFGNLAGGSNPGGTLVLYAQGGGAPSSTARGNGGSGFVCAGRSSCRTYLRCGFVAYTGGAGGSPCVCSYNQTPRSNAGGGGAAGYAGNGGGGTSTSSGLYGSGGGGGGACAWNGAGGGGGVGWWGQGPSGKATHSQAAKNGGSFGQSSCFGGKGCGGKQFGGGGGSGLICTGGNGGVHIMWPGNLRKFPNP